MSVLDRTPPKADLRLPYGPLPLQFGDLWLPAPHGAHRPKKFPVLLFVHGGWWKSVYTLDYAGFLCAAMRELGIAVWSVEYRRVGDTGGGYPGTLQDVAAAADHMAKLAEAYPLDLTRVVAAGHSAGGHLAFWLACRHHVPPALLPLPPSKLRLRSVVALAGAVDLRLTISLGGFFQWRNGAPAVRALLGGGPAQVPDRFRAANPGDLLPLGVPQILVQGTDDDQIPATLPLRWAEEARRQGDHVELVTLPRADHFDVVDPQSSSWPETREALLKFLR